MLRSERGPMSPFRVTSDPDVQITVYDTVGSTLHRRDEAIEAALPRGLYRVQLERARRLAMHIIDHESISDIYLPGPALVTPALVAGAVTSHEYYTQPAKLLSMSDTCAPLGPAPYDSRLFVFLRR